MTDNIYQRGKIYKIVTGQTDDIYVGSTTQYYLSNRLKEHRWCLTSWMKGNKTSYCTSYEIVKYPDAKIILLETYPCQSKDELRAREQHYISILPNCVNRCKAICTRDEHLERMRKWHHEHKEEVAKRAKVYREDNREYLLQKKSEYYHNNSTEINNKRRNEYVNKANELCAYQKKYRDENVEKVKARQTARIQCQDCGKEYTYSNKNKHIISKFHLSKVPQTI